MRRGDLIVVAMTGDYGKPRPALVVQADAIESVGSVVVVPITGHNRQDIPFRIDLLANADTGLRKSSQVMVDKIATVPSAKIAGRIGALDADTLARVDRALALLLGLV